MFLSSFFEHFSLLLPRNAHFRDKGTAFFAYTQARAHFFYRKSENSCRSHFIYTYCLYRYYELRMMNFELRIA